MDEVARLTELSERYLATAKAEEYLKKEAMKDRDFWKNEAEMNMKDKHRWSEAAGRLIESWKSTLTKAVDLLEARVRANEYENDPSDPDTGYYPVPLSKETIAILERQDEIQQEIFDEYTALVADEE